MMPSVAFMPIFLLAIAATSCSGQSRQSAGLPPDQTVVPDAPPRFEPHECWTAVPPAVEARCGYVVVPENRDPAAGRTRALRLAVAVLSSPGTRATAPPTLLLGGGPGQDVVALYLELIRRYQAVRDHGYPAERLLLTRDDVQQFEAVMDRLVGDLAKRELILLDQRGAGYSLPSLNCPEHEWRPCRQRLVAEGIDLTAYNTLENARDVDAVRRALDYERVDLHGGSYGTRLGLEVLRHYPQTVRAAVLEGVAPPQVEWAVTMVRGHDAALAVLFDHCRADTRCSRAFPALDSVFYRVVRRLDASPAAVQMGAERVPLSGEELRDFVWHGMYDVQVTRWLPMIITNLARGDARLWGRILAEQAADRIGEMSWGMCYSVECSDGWTVGSPAALQRAAAGLNPVVRAHVVRSFSERFQTCTGWDVPATRGLVHTPVNSDVPTLLLSGEFDPGTPPAFAELAGRTLTRSRHYVLPYLGHSDGFISECHSSIMSAFLDDPDRAPPTACLAAMDRPPFVTEPPTALAGR